MKLFGRGREHTLYDSGSMTFQWSFNAPGEALHGQATLAYNTGATTTFRMAALAGGNSRWTEALGTDEVQGALSMRGVWTASSPSLMDSALKSGTAWSLMFWAKLNRIATSATFALIEYSYGPTPSALRELNMLGVYTDQGTRQLCVQWDIAVAPSLTTQFIRTPVTIGDGGDHFALVREDDRLYVWKNGLLAYTASSLWGPSNNALTGNSSNWVLGGSYRYGLSTTTAALVSGITAGENAVLDDVVFYPRAVKPCKVRETYGAAKRTWDEEALLRSGQYKVQHRVLVQDGRTESDWIDMSTYRGRDWTLSCSVSESVEDDWKKAKIRLRRRFGRFLDLSRTNTESSTYDSGSAQQLIDLRTRVRIEYALVPTEWKVQGWEWSPLFDGFVDALDWGSDVLDIDACDRAAALADVFRVDARRYEYGPASTTRSSAHIQTLIDDNVPKTVRSGTIGGFDTWGYLGGTPLLYTPVTDAWILRYEHGGTGNMLKLVQGVADQIGWDVRYRAYHPLSEDRLTYFEPPRNLSQTPIDVREDPLGTRIRFPYPHGLQLGQSVVISDIPTYSTSGYVIAIPSWNEIIVDRDPSGTPSPYTDGGNVEHGPHFTLRASNLFDVGRVSANIADIRNHIVIKFNRENTAATYWVESMYDDGGGNLIVELPEGVDVSVLEAGQEATISQATPGWYNATRAIVAVNGNAVELTPAGGTGSTTSGIFYSEYLSFNQAVFINTASISKYGLRSAGVFEGSIEGVDTWNEANSLGRGMLSDMADPTVDLSATATCLPHVELHDLLALEADPLGRWAAMNVAVVGYTHNLGPASTTELSLRHDHPSKGTGWLNRGRGLVLDIPGNFGLPDRNIDIDFDLDWEFDLNPDIGPMFMSTWKPMSGKRSWLHDRTEVHFSTGTSGFLPTPGTLADSTRGGFSAAGGYSSARFSPGTTYYVKYRHRDKWGNVSGVHSGSTIGYVLRFLPKPPAAKAMIVSSVTVEFEPQVWQTVFGITSVTSAYDAYGNFREFAPVTGATPAPPGSSTANYFLMPCDGAVTVDGKLGLRYSGSKSTAQIAIGLFVWNGSGGTSAPYIYPKLTLLTSPATTSLVESFDDGAGGLGVPGFLIGWDVRSVPAYPGAAFNVDVPLATTMYLTWSETISASSGDKIAIAVRPGNGTTDVYLNPTDGSTTASTGFIKYTVVAQSPPAND